MIKGLIVATSLCTSFVSRIIKDISGIDRMSYSPSDFAETRLLNYLLILKSKCTKSSR